MLGKGGAWVCVRGMSTCKALAYSYFTIVLYIFRVCYSILDIYHAFEYKVVCHAVLFYDEDLSGYRCLVRGLHGCVFGECRLARHLLASCLLAYSYFTIVLYIFSLLCHAVLLCVENLFKLLSILLILLIVRRIILT